MKNVSLAQKITESGLMIALSTILSIVKLIDLPYGGSITFASMLPVIIIAMRYGTVWGLFTGFTHGLIQLLLGSSALSYATSSAAAIAIIMLDYVLAFSVIGFTGFFKNIKNKSLSFGIGAFCACGLRYILHVISGCTVWAGLSIPTLNALTYSLVYNATYMIPETIVTVIAAVYVAGVIDFSKPKLNMIQKKNHSKTAKILSYISGLISVIAITIVLTLVFPCLQNADSGEFDITGITNVNSTALIITVGVAALLITAITVIKHKLPKKD